MRNQRARRGYRIHLSPVHRALRSAVLLVCLALSLSLLFTPGLGFESRALSVIATATALWSLRFLWGSVVVVQPGGLRIQKWWPVSRDIPWYRILQVDIVPGYWFLDVELNSGEHLELPCVRELDDLWDMVERYRNDLDRVSG